MAESFTFAQGTTPLLLSVPHDGRRLPDEIARRMTPAGLDMPDTDWHVAKLYDFAAATGASLIVANCSRYVVDLNRAAADTSLYEGQVATGLCPEKTFAGENIYEDGASVGAGEKAARIEAYWRPYHDQVAMTLTALRERFGYALLWDAHSIPGEVPRLFDGELPALNLGTNDERACTPELADAVFRVAERSSYPVVRNGRFKGGYITRHYGTPDADVHAVQLEIAQRTYMNEASRAFDAANADLLREALTQMIDAFQDAASERYA